MGGNYSARSAQSVIKLAYKKAKIRKDVSLHTLRTTEIYTHITIKGMDKIINPLDRLDL